MRRKPASSDGEYSVRAASASVRTVLPGRVLNPRHHIGGSGRERHLNTRPHRDPYTTARPHDKSARGSAAPSTSQSMRWTCPALRLSPTASLTARMVAVTSAVVLPPPHPGGMLVVSTRWPPAVGLPALS